MKFIWNLNESELKDMVAYYHNKSHAKFPATKDNIHFTSIDKAEIIKDSTKGKKGEKGYMIDYIGPKTAHSIDLYESDYIKMLKELRLNKIDKICS